jgi:hypothetical protein
MGFLLMFGNQLLGVYVMANYGVLIYAQLGQGSSMSLLLNACWTTVTMFVPSIFLPASRRPNGMLTFVHAASETPGRRFISTESAGARSCSLSL